MKTLYKYFALALIGISLYACKKELSALPPNEKVDANTIVDQPTAIIALNGAYFTFANATIARTGWQDHQIRPAMLSGNIMYAYATYPEEQNLNTSIPSHFWSESYILLNAANGVIKGVNNVPDTKFTSNKKKEILAEARFLRAYGHFKLLTYYGEWYKEDSNFGILLRTELSTLGNIVKPRSTVKESYDQIIADLDEVIANGPATRQGHYATRWAGMALKARILMCRGTDADYAEIIALTNNLITNGPFVLEANPMDIFRTKGLTSKEVILGIKPQSGQELDFYSKSNDYLPNGSMLWAATPYFKNLLSNDPRQAWLTGAGTAITGRECYYFTKYTAAGPASTVSETDYALRLTEAYLLQAEAIVRSGGSLAAAKEIVHTVQAKSRITATENNAPYLAIEQASTSAALITEIYKETVKSLAAEDGIEWLALLRLPFAEVKMIKPTITSQTQYILPVPASEFIYNPSFGPQNPGYSSN